MATKQRRAHRQGEQGEAGVQRSMTDGHPERAAAAVDRGEQAVHGEGLQREGVGGHPVEEVAHSAAAVKGEREPVEVGVEIAAQIAHHALADADGRAVVHDGEGAEQRVR